MKIVNYWEQFLNTGRIEDYLAYREEKAAMLDMAEPEKNEGAEEGAGTNWCYRDHFKNGTHWGI